jgi:hypothetical protein
MKGDGFMLDKDALIKQEGSICDEYECIVCRESIKWYAPVEENYLKKEGYKKAEIIVDEGCTLNRSPFEQELIAKAYIIVECPHCKIKNKFTGVRWKVK